MELLLQILLALVALVCLLGGMNLLLKGAKSFLPKTIPDQPVLDDLFRFLSGIYFGLGILMAWVVFNFHKIDDLIYFIGIVVLFSGLGRLYSRIKAGAAGRYFDVMMVFEIILGVVIMVLQYDRARH